MAEEFKDSLKLDKNMLDVHAIEQPELFHKWATKWAMAQLKRDQAKDRLSVARAESDEAIRKDPESYGWDGSKSPTEKFIESQVLVHKKYKDALKEYQDAVEEANTMMIAKEAIEVKGRSLDILVRLFVAGYFSTKPVERYTSSIPEASKAAQDEKLQESGTRLKKLIKKAE